MLGKRLRAKFYSNHKGILSFARWRHIWKCLTFSIMASLPMAVDASSLSAPSTVQTSGSSATFTISWTCSTTYCILEDGTDGSWNGVASSSGSGSTSLTRSVGRHSFRLRSCTVTGSRYGTTTDCTNGSSKYVVVVAPLGLPGSIAVDAGHTNDGHFTLSWGPSSNFIPGNVYYVFRSKNGGSWQYLRASSSRTYSESGLSAGTYKYRIRACGSACSSWRYSSNINVSTPSSVPSLTLPSTSGSGSYGVSWSSVANSTSYTLQERVGSGSWSTVQSSSSRSKSFSGKLDNSFGYRVRACNRVGCTAFSSAKTIHVALTPSVPSSLSVPTYDVDGTFSVSWGASSGRVSKYDLDRMIGGGSFNSIYDGTGRSRSESSLGNGTYTYRVRACNTIGSYTNCSGWRTAGINVAHTPGVPSSVSLPASDGDGGFTFSWGAATGTVSYYEATRVGSDGSPTIYTGLSRSVSQSGIGNGSYSFRVRACNVVGSYTTCSGWRSASIDVAHKPSVPTPLTLPSTNNNGSFSVSWGASSGRVSKYDLDRQLGTGSWTNVSDSTSLYSTQSGLADGSYNYRVRACNTVGSYTNCSGWRTGSVNTARAPGVPAFLDVPTSDADGTFPVTWGTSTGSVTKYDLDRQLGTGSWANVYDNTGLSSPQSGLADGSYNYRVRACNTVGTYTNCSGWRTATTKVAHTPDAPPSINVPPTDGDGAFTITWAVPSGNVTFYYLEREGHGINPTIYSGSDPTYSQTGLSDGTYTYRVKACNVVGSYTSCSDWRSASIDVAHKPSMPTPLTVPPTNNNGAFTVSWGASTSGRVTKYDLDRQLGSGSWANAYDGTNLSHPQSGLTDGSYNYRVRACNTVGSYMNCSGWRTASINLARTPSVPGPFQFSSTNPNGAFAVDWLPSTGRVSKYKLDRRVDNGPWQRLHEGSAPTAPSESGLPDGTYNYRVQACNTVGTYTSCSGWRTGGVDVARAPGVPPSITLPSSTVFDGSFTVSWAASSGTVTKYDLDLQLGTGSWANAYDGIELSSDQSDLADGSYNFRVRACNTVGSYTNCSGWRTNNVNVVNAPAPGVPGPFELPRTDGDGAVTVTWAASSGTVTKYDLDRKLVTGTGSWINIHDNSGLSSLQTGLGEGSYTFRVRACNTVGAHTNCSDWRTGGDFEISDLNNDGTNDVIKYDDDGVATTKYLTGGGTYVPGDGDNPVSPQQSRYTFSADTAAPTNQEVGALEGSFRVNEAGAATYSIPLMLPQGTAGVTPQLSFNYSSQGGSGIMGEGWSVSGHSKIMRCRQTLSQDGASTSLRLNHVDRFCLDGQRLILVSGSRYGAVGAEYRTEVNGYSIVKSVGGDLGNPSHFTVEAKDGSIRTYGHTSDSRELLKGKTLIWSQSRFADSVGNQIDYKYTGTPTSGHRLSRVDYAFPQVNNNYNPGASVQFHYIDGWRPDTVHSYIGGEQFSGTKLLESVSVHNRAEDQLVEVRRYHLEYLPENTIETDYISRLESIQLCTDATKNTCLAPTSVEWANGSNVSWSEDIAGTPFYAGSAGPEFSLQDGDKVLDYRLLDINGDGRQDLFWVEYDEMDAEVQYLNYVVSLGSRGYSSVRRAGTLALNLNSPLRRINLHVLDYNGDGRQDVVVHFKDDSIASKIHLFLATPDDHTGGWKLVRDTNEGLPTMFAGIDTKLYDFDGDGMLDLHAFYGGKEADAALRVQYLKPRGVAASSDKYYSYDSNAKIHSLVNAPPLYPTNQWGVQPYWEFHGASIIPDFDGDGQPDLLVEAEQFRFQIPEGQEMYGPRHVGQGKQWLVFVRSGENFRYANEVKPVDEGGLVDLPHMFVDLNGDGLHDIIFRDDQQWKFSFSTGSKFTTPQYLTVIPSTLELEDLQITDVNGDGYPDLIQLHNEVRSRGVKAYLWRPSSLTFNSKPVVLARFAKSEDESVSIFDVNGDGWKDVVRFTPGDDRWKIWLSNNTGELPLNLASSIQEGHGNKIDIEYDLLTSTNRYKRIDTGRSEVAELEQVCATDPRARNVHCVTPKMYDFDMASFYESHNNVYAGLPAGNEKLSDIASGSAVNAPVLEIYAPMPVVTDVSSSSPTADNPQGQAKVSYYYGQMKFQAGGRGSLGFKSLTSVDHQSGIVTETNYRQDWPFIGSPLSTTTRMMASSGSVADGLMLSESENKWALRQIEGVGGSAVYQTYVKNSVEKQYDLPAVDATTSTLLSTIISETAQDAYGNVTDITTRTLAGSQTHEKSASNDYGVTEDDQRLGRLRETTVTITIDGQLADTRRAEFEYYDSGSLKGLLKKEVAAADSLISKTTTHYYDSYGNKERAQVQGHDGTVRSSDTKKYDAGRYLYEVVNPLGHTVKRVISRNNFGQPTRVQNIHGAFAENYYDSFGRTYLSKAPDGSWERTEIHYCTGSVSGEAYGDCPSYALYYETKQFAGGGEKVTYYDAIKRPIRTRESAFEADHYVYTDSQYDQMGHTTAVSTPYKGMSAGQVSPAGWTKTEYDVLGRVTEIVQADLSKETYQYSGYLKTITNDLDQTKVEEKDFLGNLIKVTDNMGGWIDYTYDVDGKLETATTDGPGVNPVQVKLCYDDLGRKVAMHDPDKGGFQGGAALSCGAVLGANEVPTGWWRYVYNGIGDLKEQTDPKGQRQVMTYDTLGRKKTRTAYKNNNSVEQHTRWYYDKNSSGNTEPGELGNLTYVTQSDGQISEACSAQNFCEIYVYDRLGRSTDTLTFHPDTAMGYLQSVVYDDIGRTYVQRDAMQGLVGPDSGIYITYNQNGYQEQTIDLATGDKLHIIKAINERGQITQEMRADGVTTTYVYKPLSGTLESQTASVDAAGIVSIQDIAYSWDTLGNLKYRHNRSSTADLSANKSKDLKESFCYDGLNRLIKSHVGTLSGSCSLVPDQQDVEYDALGNITRKYDVGTYEYGSVAGPHAVTKAGNVSYGYDGNGNQVSGDGRSLQYNTFDKPVYISKNGHKTRFRYGPGNSRYQRTDQKDSRAEKTTTYLGSVERIEVAGSGKITWRRHVAGAVYIIETGTNYRSLKAVDKSYIYKDHLGSTDIITQKISGQQSIRQSMSFDAWGNRRYSGSWIPFSNEDLLGFNTEVTNRGYTGHEQLDETGLIHMNGRVYDPKLARFLQADPFIQAASNTQSYNRYSYLLNNPLNATDPSGFFFKKLWDKVIKPFIGVLVAFACHGICGPILTGLFAGAASAAANGGNVLLAAITGAIGGAWFDAIGGAFGGLDGGLWAKVGSIAAHGTVGGVMSVMQGGEFGHGFVSAGIAKAANVNQIMKGDISPLARGTRIFSAALVGGTTSKITGGKFANGATTAALGQALNGESSQNAINEAQKEQARQLIAEFRSVVDEVSGGNPFYEDSLPSSAARMALREPIWMNEGTAKIASFSPSANDFGQLSIGPSFFKKGAPPELILLAPEQAEFLVDQSLKFQQVFRLRHEAEHLSSKNRNLPPAFNKERTLPAGNQEIMATEEAYRWTKENFEKFE